jgi:hypothetical protein
MKSAILLINYLLTSYIVFSSHFFIVYVLDAVSKKLNGVASRAYDHGPVLFQAYRNVFHPNNLFFLFIELTLLSVIYVLMFFRREIICMYLLLAVTVLLTLVSLYVIPVFIAISIWLQMSF